MNILREKNMQILKLFKAIEEQYDIAEKESNHFQFKYNKEVYELDEMLKEVPQEYWIQ
jgi:ribosome recycling factor